ncbi:MAG TPA: hypothetical protein VFQ93_09485 [Casimicrobiaceae bacterium]|nr:hypothetical protein [Casimicrobiaceae bacterium]
MLGLALEANRRHRIEAEHRSSEAIRDGADENFAWLRKVLQACGDVDGVADHRVLLVTIGTESACEDTSRRDAEMHVQCDTVSVAKRFQCLHHVECGAQRPLGVVLVRDRRAEEPHDRVADELVDDSSVRLDDRHQSVEAAVDEAAHPFGIGRFR